MGHCYRIRGCQFKTEMQGIFLTKLNFMELSTTENCGLDSLKVFKEYLRGTEDNVDQAQKRRSSLGQIRCDRLEWWSLS